MADVGPPRATYAEYLAQEAGSAVKREYVGGRIIAMAGGTVEHARLASRLMVLLGNALDGQPCAVVGSDVRVRIRTADRATYPDLLVVCGSVDRDPDDRHAVTNPTVIVEVLSDSTAESDRGDKFADYRRLPSLQEYVLVSQRERRIDVYRRDGRRWVLEEHGPGEDVRLASVDAQVPVDRMYEDALGAIVA